MELGFKVNVEPHLCVEWTVKMPIQADCKTSADFAVGDTKCYLTVNNHGGYKLVLYVCDAPTSPLQVTTYLMRGVGLFLTQATTADVRGCHDIWMGSESHVLTVVPDFTKHRICCFRVVVHASRCRLESPGDKLKSVKSIQDSSGCLQSLAHDLGELQEDSTYHDVKLRCDGQILPAHRNILSARSEVFRAMLQADMQESRTGFVDIRDMAFPALQHFLGYLYTGTLSNLTVDLAMQLYEAGDKYAVSSLVKRCSEFMMGNIEDGNACNLLLLAQVHDDQDLKESALWYIKENKIPRTWEGWREFCDSHQKLAIDVLNYLYLES